MKWILGIGIAVLAAGAGVFCYQYFSSYEPRAAMAFINAYAEYDELMAAEEARVYVPGQGSNADRALLNEILNDILSQEGTTLTSSERLASAEEGLVHLAELKGDIDTAQSSHASIYASIDQVEEAGSGLRTTRLRDQGEAVIALMKERQDITTRITALQSATNEHAEDILQKVAKEGGELSKSLIIYINEGTPAAEARFDELNRLYSELSAIRGLLDTAHSQFIALAL